MDLRVCAYEDRPEAMDAVILMGESLCRVDRNISLHLTVPNAPESIQAWAKRRPEVTLSTRRPEGVSGWNVKPWLLLQELKAGRHEALWLDNDIIVTRPISSLIKEFPSDALIGAEEWHGPLTAPVSHLWGLPPGRRIDVFNNCFVRVTQAHAPLLEDWLQMLRDPRYLEAQALPFERRPIQFLHDGWPLIALVESERYCHVPFDSIRLGRHIAQCAGSSGYRPRHRLLDLFRGPPALIHGIGRKPWTTTFDPNRLHRFLIDLATDLSPYVLAARRVAKWLEISPPWLEARTSPGALFRWLAASHPGMAGMPLAVSHSVFMGISRMIGSSEKESANETDYRELARKV
jgi:hypothetical protein